MTARGRRRQLGQEFGFAAEATGIVADVTLDSLGQIAARGNPANEPRTVTAAFTLLARRCARR